MYLTVCVRTCVCVCVRACVRACVYARALACLSVCVRLCCVDTRVFVCFCLAFAPAHELSLSLAPSHAFSLILDVHVYAHMCVCMISHTESTGQEET